jgi:hypothetical protein
MQLPKGIFPIWTAIFLFPEKIIVLHILHHDIFEKAHETGRQTIFEFTKDRLLLRPAAQINFR